MVTPVKGDRESKEVTVYQALDQAFFDRVSRIFDAMCDCSEPDQAAARFVRRFKATAIEQEYPKA